MRDAAPGASRAPPTELTTDAGAAAADAAPRTSGAPLLVHVVATAPKDMHLFPLAGGGLVATGPGSFAVLRGEELYGDPSLLGDVPPEALQSASVRHVAGHWPDAVWFDSVGMGGVQEPPNALYRWDDGERALRVARADAPLAVDAWSGGRLLGLVAITRVLPTDDVTRCPNERFAVLRGSPAALPAIDPTISLSTFLAFDTGEVLAFGRRCSEDTVLVSRWTPGSARAAVSEPPIDASDRDDVYAYLERSIAARGPSDVWLAGQVGSGGAARLTLAHWNGAAWKRVDAPDVHRSGASLSVSPSGELWVAARDDGLFRRSAATATWTRVDMRAQNDGRAIEDAGAPEDVWARADDDLWIATDMMILRTRAPRAPVVVFPERSVAEAQLYDLEPETPATPSCARLVFVRIASGSARASFGAARARFDALPASMKRHVDVGEAVLWKRRVFGAVAGSYGDAVQLARALAKDGGEAPTLYCRPVTVSSP